MTLYHPIKFTIAVLLNFFSGTAPRKNNLHDRDVDRLVRSIHHHVVRFVRRDTSLYSKTLSIDLHDNIVGAFGVTCLIIWLVHPSISGCEPTSDRDSDNESFDVLVCRYHAQASFFKKIRSPDHAIQPKMVPLTSRCCRLVWNACGCFRVQPPLFVKKKGGCQGAERVVYHDQGSYLVLSFDSTCFSYPTIVQSVSYR